LQQPRIDLLAQTFETTLNDRALGGRLRFITVPRRSLLESSNLLSALDLRTREFVDSIEEVESGLREALSVDYGYEPVDPTASWPDAAGEFVRTCLRADLIPFEQSPLDLTSIEQLVRTASGTAIGAYVGFIIAGPTPLLLITVPAGMVICGTAAGVARALEAGLYERLARAMGVPVAARGRGRSS
jgi:hypothetical protein